MLSRWWSALLVIESRSYSRDLHSVRRVRIKLLWKRTVSDRVTAMSEIWLPRHQVNSKPETSSIAAIDRSALSWRACVFRVFSLAECELLQSFFSLFRRRRSDSEVTQNGCKILTRGTKLTRNALSTIRRQELCRSICVTIGSTPLSCTLPLAVLPLPPSVFRRRGLVSPTLPRLSSSLLSPCCLFLSSLFLAHRERGSSRTTRPSVESSTKRKREKERRMHTNCSTICCNVCVWQTGLKSVAEQ